MTFDFHTRNSIYTFTSKGLFRNGELVARGNLYPFQLRIGRPAVIFIESPSGEQSTFSTSNVEAVLPKHEFVDGSRIYEVFLNN